MTVADHQEPAHTSAAAGFDDGLLSRVQVIESLPLNQRAAGFEQLYAELVTELQRGDSLDE